MKLGLKKDMKKKIVKSAVADIKKGNDSMKGDKNMLAMMKKKKK